MVPSPFVFVILALAAYRLTRLVGWDDFPPIAKLRDKITGAGNDVFGRYKRPILEHFITCPFCVGFWISLVVYLCWLGTQAGTLYGAMPFALSGAVGLLSKNLDP